MRGYVKRVSQKADKLSVEQLRSLLDDMMEENGNLYSILESVSAGLLIVDNNFILQQTNTLVESRLPFNIRTDDIKASSVPIWEILDDPDIAQFFKNCKEKEITNCSEEFTTTTSGGTIRFLTITMTPLMHDGKLSGRIFLVMDVTENKNQEVMLHRMENMANLTNLAAGMAHEIKNPLGAISIHIQLIQKALKKARENQDKLPEKKFVEDHIDVVNEEIEHLNKLVMDFLLAVRPVKATLELKNPEDIILNTVEFITPEFNRSGVNIEFNNSGLNKKILLDEKLLRDVIMNLAQNSLAAIKSYRKDDGLFKIRCYIKENKYIIETSDNGCGMDSETLSKIFEPYYTTKANGTGLGMTMVYKIIKEFSGEIVVDSEKDAGTKFTLIFPLPQKDKKLLTSETE
jgi:PAS domain S-box-containing protein